MRPFLTDEAKLRAQGLTALAEDVAALVWVLSAEETA